MQQHGRFNVKRLAVPLPIFPILSACLFFGCAHAQDPKIDVPKDAFHVSEERPDDTQYGIKFDIKAVNSSYEFVNSIRNQLLQRGYLLCKKSAIQTWQSVPRDQTGKTWVVEMFATPTKNSFAVMKVIQSNAGSDPAVQSFSIAVQNVKAPNLKNIEEFCD
jgi:hypothetical protein